MLFQPRQPLPRILHLSYPRVSILPQGEGFLIMLYGLVVRSKILKAEANPSASHISKRVTLSQRTRQNASLDRPPKDILNDYWGASGLLCRRGEMAQLREPCDIIPGNPSFGNLAVCYSMDTDYCHLE